MGKPTFQADITACITYALASCYCLKQVRRPNSSQRLVILVLGGITSYYTLKYRCTVYVAGMPLTSGRVGRSLSIGRLFVVLLFPICYFQSGLHFKDSITAISCCILCCYYHFFGEIKIHNFRCILPVAVTRSSCGGIVVIC